MQNLGRTSLHRQYNASGTNQDFLERAIDALSVIKISNTYLQSTLTEDNTNEKTLATFEKIKKSLLKIETFLDSAKYEQNFLAKNKQEHSSKNIKKRWFTLSELMQMIKPKNVPSTIQINLPKNDFRIFGNFYKLVVVFSNLVENSIQAMKNNGVINIFARDGTDFIVIDVKDSGPGLAEEVIKKAFSSLVTTKSDGSGLGLKVAKTVIETHGGTISVRSNPTTFSIKLPKQ